MLDIVRKCKHVWLGHVLLHESLLHDIIEGRMTGKSYSRQKKNAPDEQPGERKVCGTQKNSWRQKRVAEIVKSWKSYTRFSADYLKKKSEWHNTDTALTATVIWTYKLY